MFTVQTVYRRADFKGLMWAYLSGMRGIRILQKVERGIMTILAAFFWLLAGAIAAAQLLAGSLRVILSGLPLVGGLVLLGLWLYRVGRPKYGGGMLWRAYPERGRQLTFHFSPEEFTLESGPVFSKIAYSGVVRLCEDQERFYLFITPKTAHILPKRDIEQQQVEPLGRFLAERTGLPMERVP